MSETPRTDAFIETTSEDPLSVEELIGMHEFARQLEREISTLKASRAAIVEQEQLNRAEANRLRAELAGVKASNEGLRQELQFSDKGKFLDDRAQLRKRGNDYAHQFERAVENWKATEKERDSALQQVERLKAELESYGKCINNLHAGQMPSDD